MIAIGQIQEIIAQYEKHGWNLRRVLLSAENKNSSPQTISGNVEIIESNIDALWFSRPSNEGREAWELRRLSGAPFALVEVFEADDDEEVREEARQEMETRVAELASKFGDKKVKG